MQVLASECEARRSFVSPDYQRLESQFFKSILESLFIFIKYWDVKTMFTYALLTCRVDKLYKIIYRDTLLQQSQELSKCSVCCYGELT